MNTKVINPNYTANKPLIPVSGVNTHRYNLRMYQGGTLTVEKKGIGVFLNIDKLDDFLHDHFQAGKSHCKHSEGKK